LAGALEIGLDSHGGAAMAVKISKAGNKAGHIDEFQIEYRTGTVVADRAWGRSTGGGYIDSRGGSIQITNTDVTRLFVQDDNGQEFDTELQNTSVVAREGHRVSCVYAAKNNKDYGVAFINHSTGRSQIFDKNLNPLLGIYNMSGCGLMVVISLLSLFVMPVAAVAVIFLGIPAGIIVDTLRNKSRREARRQEVLARIRNEVQRIIEEESTRASEA